MGVLPIARWRHPTLTLLLVYPVKALAENGSRSIPAITLLLATVGCLGGAVVGRRSRDRKVASSTPGRGAIESTKSTQPSIPPRSVSRVPACMAGVRRGAFTCVGWQVTLCDPIWQVTSRSSEVGFPQEELYRPFLTSSLKDKVKR